MPCFPWAEPAVCASIQRFVIGGCHSLMDLNGTLIGDPLDMAALKYSGWRYNRTAECYVSDDADLASDTQPVKLWQIRSFPFDPTKRLSSALVLAQLKDRSYELWSLTKGSPESVLVLCHRMSDEAGARYKSELRRLEGEGHRIIALSARKITNSTDVLDQLFPDGLSSKRKALRQARTAGRALHRNEFERKNEDDKDCFNFLGFACFSTAIRPSSKRVIGEIRRGGIQTIMLTGDAIDAAIAVSLKVSLLAGPKIAIVEVKENECEKSPCLVWRFLKAGSSDQWEMTMEKEDIRNSTLQSTRDILRLQRRGGCAIAATGRAIEMILDKSENNIPMKVKRLLANNMFRFAVIARATPLVKKKVMSCLKDTCNQQVIMCGKYNV